MELYSILLVSFLFTSIESARILAVIPYNARSHFAMYELLFQALAARGHNIDVVSHYPLKNSVPNYRDLSIEGSIPPWDDNVTLDMVDELTYLNTVPLLWLDTIDSCEKVMNHTVLKLLLKSEQKYDLVITEIFGSDCVVGFAHKFKTPLISVMSSVALPWAYDRVGNPDHPGYIPSYFLPFTDKMNFMQRLINTVYTIASNWGNYFVCDKYTDHLAKEFFGEDIPTVWELVKHTSLILVNTHFSMNLPRPLVPAVVEVGGLHIKEPKKLPEDIKSFLDESKYGVIYFSLGTMVRVETFSPEKLKALLDVLSELPQRVLLKCGADSIPGVPSNVKMAKWLPQLDILSHPNVRVFVTHGGLMGTQEAVYAGVPMIGIPMFSDQRLNLVNYISKGIAIIMEYETITTESVAAAFKTVLHNPSYREKAQHLSRLFRDRPMSALDTAVFWTEYVIRHGGAPHLRSAAVDMPLYQYLLLDVIAVIVLTCILVLLILWLGLTTVIGFVISRNKRTNHSKKKSAKLKHN